MTTLIRNSRGRLARPLIFLVLIGCASGGGTSRPTTSHNRNLISEAEIRESHAQDVYQLVRELRAFWLSTRGVTSVRDPMPVMVYIDGVRAGSTERLRDLQPKDVSELRYLSSTEATQMYGTNHPSGAILVTSRRGGT